MRRTSLLGRIFPGSTTRGTGLSKVIERSWGHGAALLAMSTLAVAASLELVLSGGNAIYCERLAPLGVLAALSALLIALGFHALGPAPRRSVIGFALLLASISLFADTRFLARYHGPCQQVQRQLRQQTSASH